MHKLNKMQTKLHIKKGDTVVVIAGNYKGQQGKVLEVVREKTRAIVEGSNGKLVRYSKKSGEEIK